VLLAVGLGRRHDRRVFGGLHDEQVREVRAAVNEGRAPSDPRLADATVAHAEDVERTAKAPRPRWRQLIDVAIGVVAVVSAFVLELPLIAGVGVVLIVLVVAEIRRGPSPRRDHARRARAAAEQLLGRPRS
jgi:hypothetical protein